jgi:ketosteroid isomerase-like protein
MIIRRLFFMAVATVLVFAGVAIGQADPTDGAPSSPDPEVREVEVLEDEWNTANEVSDVEVKLRLLAEDSYHVGPSGRIYGKQQDIDATRAARRQKDASPATLKFAVTERRIRIFRKVAVVTGSAVSMTSHSGQTRAGNPFRFVHVWEKRGGTWQLTVDQVTGVGN